MTIDASHDAGPLFTGIDAPGYSPWDAGPRPPEPCGATVRRVRFPVDETSLSNGNRLWGAGRLVWGFLGSFGDRPSSVHLYDVDAAAEIPVGLALDGAPVVAVFETGTGSFDLVVGGDLERRIVTVDREGTTLGTSVVQLDAAPRVRLPDGRLVSYSIDREEPSPARARLDVATPGGVTVPIDLGFYASEDHLVAMQWTGSVLVGIAHQTSSSSLLRFEVDVDAETVLAASELLAGVRIVGAGPGSTSLALWADADEIAVAVAYEPVDSPGLALAELLWWPVGGGELVRRVVRPLDTLPVGILAFGGAPPRQTLALAQSSGTRTWISAARVRGPGDVVGGVETLSIVTDLRAGSAWEPEPGSAALGLLGSRELEVIYLCEGAP